MPLHAQEDGSPPEVSLGQGSPAKALKRPLPRVPAEYGGYEGWVVVSFVVKTDGSVADVIVEDSTAREFEELVLPAVQKWKYEPATIGGRPVEQSVTGVPLLFTLDRPRGLSRQFIQLYQEQRRKLEADEIEAAQRRIAELTQSADISLRERAYVAVLDAALRQKKGEEARELRSLERATIDGGSQLEKDAYAAALTSMFRLRIQREELARALATFEDLAKLQTPSGALVSLAQRARAFISSDVVIGRKGRIATQSEIEADDASRTWSHALVRREIAFQGVQGSLETIDFRCSGHRVTDAITEEKAWKIPSSWGPCVVYVSGQPGTTFTLVEYPAESPTRG